MAENLKLLRFYFVLLAIFVVGRWALGFGGADYDKTHQVFSIVILTNISVAYYAFITRRFLGGGIKRAIVLGVTAAVVSQLMILVSTALSYLGGMETFWNNARALNSEQPVAFGAAMALRAFGLVVNSIVNAIVASIGYGIAAVVPREG